MESVFHHRVIIMLALSACACAQYTTASLGGSIADTTGARVAATKVSVKNTETGFTLSTVADSEGDFLFPRLPVGSYELTADKPGFSTYVQKGIGLTVNQLATQTI